jgi:hypothetical protein
MSLGERDARPVSASAPTLIPFVVRCPDYVKVALRSADDFRNDVVLLGDAANRESWKNHWDSTRASLPKWRQFTDSYVHMSAASQSFEMTVWRRPFVIEHWMKEHGVRGAFVMDADTVTFADYSRTVLPALPRGCAAALMTCEDQSGFDWATSLHFSYWTFEAIADFASFCVEAYRDAGILERLRAKYRWHLENRQPGGICDMTLLHFWRERNEGRTWNAARVWDGMVADLAVTAGDNCFKREYAMRGGFKKLTFKNGVPYGFNTILGQPIRFLYVHCQGSAKPLGKFLYNPVLRHVYAELYHLRRGKARMRTWAKWILRTISRGQYRRADSSRA